MITDPRIELQNISILLQLASNFREIAKIAYTIRKYSVYYYQWSLGPSFFYFSPNDYEGFHCVRLKCSVLVAIVDHSYDDTLYPKLKSKKHTKQLF